MNHSVHMALPAIWILALCMLSGIGLHAAPAGDVGATVAAPPPGLTIFVHVLHGRTRSRTEGETSYTDYLSGMPVFFLVRLVNGPGMWSADVAPLLVPEGWRRALVWRIQDKEGNEVPIAVTESPMKGAQDPPSHEGKVPLLRGIDLADGWKIAGKDTATLNGEYRMLVNWGDIQQAQGNVLRFRPPENDAEKAYVLIRQADQLTRDGDARAAIRLLQGVIEKHGELFGEDGAPAVLFLGHAFAANDDPRSALRCYKLYVEEYRRHLSPGGELPMQVEWLLSRAEQNAARREEQEKQEQKKEKERQGKDK